MIVRPNSEWTYNDVPFTSEDAQARIDEGYIGFIYIVTDTKENKKYLGKKLLVSKRRLPPLKGKTRKRIKIVESDWKTYFGSSEVVQQLVEERGEDFRREILFFCKSKGELNYIESAEQFRRGVLLSDEWYNGIIDVKIHKSHVKNLKHTYDPSLFKGA